LFCYFTKKPLLLRLTDSGAAIRVRVGKFRLFFIVIEMAAASGLHLVFPKDRDPLYTTTYGVGELMAAALDQGVERIILGLGGSATNDGGAGMVQSLGGKLLLV
jgi:glycerate kinase